MGYEAVIFDLDGTLLDTLTDIADAMNAVLIRFGFPTHTVQTYRRFLGDGLEVLVERSLPEDRRTRKEIDRCVTGMRQEYAQRWWNTSRPYDGVPEMLDRLSADGILMAILSNKLEVFTKLMASSLLGSWTFKEVVGLRPDLPRKPDPTGALEISRALGVSPERCVFVGDSGIDMMTAVRAGMVPAGVLWGYQERETLATGGARLFLRHPRELADHLAF
ncbi:MAG: HAD family hydrolase [Desulfomonilia bacterium]|nr:HAD family hydrolase [Desulfomonilia bacterium]